MNSEQPAGERTRVLLVEDHLIIRQALKLGLENLGFEVYVPPSFAVDEVVAAADDCEVDVVLLDFYLDECDSLPMIAPLVHLEKRVIMLTGVSDPRLLGRCLALGAIGVVQKAQPLDTLVHAITDVTNGHTILRPTDRDQLVEASRRADAEENARIKPFEALTSREKQVLIGLIDGKAAEQIARDEFVSLATVRSHIRSILVKLDVNSQLAAVALARKAGWGEARGIAR